MARKEIGDSELRFELDGILPSDVKATIVEQFIKYILYQRQQIPTTFEALSTELQKKMPQQKNPINLELKKEIDLVKNMEKLSSSLQDIFLHGLVKEVLLVLGATPFSPKESYRLHFPCAFYEGSMLTVKQCTSLLFRKLIANDFLMDLKPPNKCTKLLLFILAPRDRYLNPGILIPKLNLKIPENRGSTMSIHFDCTATESSADLSRFEYEDCDISGIEPLEKMSKLSITNATPQTNNQKSCVSKTPYTPPCSSQKKNGVWGIPTSRLYTRERTNSTSSFTGELDDKHNSHTDVLTSSNSMEEDFVWYQIQTDVVGYKDKSKKFESESIFMI